MKNIGVFLDTEGSHGGVHQYALSLVSAMRVLPQNHFRVTYICATNEWANYCEANNLTYYYTNKILSKDNAFKFIVSFISASIKRTDILEQKKKCIDYIIFPSVTPCMLFIKNPICAIHDLMHRYAKGFPEMCSPYQFILRDILFRQIATKSKCVLVDSQIGKSHVEESYFKGISTSKICVLPFIAPEYIYKNDKLIADDNWVQIEPQLPAKFFFYPAQFWKHKNHITIIRALKNLLDAYPDMNLVFVGSNKNASTEIHKYISENNLANRIHIFGYVSDYSMIQLYKRSCALIMASCCGPTNIPQLEGFYLGCPVIVADVFAVHEQVGDAALLFQPYDDKALSRHMENLWSNPSMREHLINLGNQRSSEWGPKQFSDCLKNILYNITNTD